MQWFRALLVEKAQRFQRTASLSAPFNNFKNDSMLCILLVANGSQLKIPGAVDGKIGVNPCAADRNADVAIMPEVDGEEFR